MRYLYLGKEKKGFSLSRRLQLGINFRARGWKRVLLVLLGVCVGAAVWTLYNNQPQLSIGHTEVAVASAGKTDSQSLSNGKREYQVQSGDTVFSLGKSFFVPWQAIVNLNFLQPPYSLKSGQVIILPKTF